MADPNNISLHCSSAHSRRDVYILIHFANIIRKNILFIAPGIDPRAFKNFIRGPSVSSIKAMQVATNNLQQTITKSVVAGLGKYQVEAKDNINFTPYFSRIFKNNFSMQENAASFFIRNLTTACCNSAIVFLIQPYLVFRYGLKSRECWIDRCRFIWMGCGLFRIPSLLPVVAAQIILYTIKIFIQEPSLTRKEELAILAEIISFMPGMVNVVKPPFGMGLSVWYKEMARHRRIVLEAIKLEAENGLDVRYYNPPYSMIKFASITELTDFIDTELKECDKQETIEKEKGTKRYSKNDYTGEDSFDEEDSELLLLGGYGGRVSKVEDGDSDEIEKEYYEEDDDSEEHSEAFTQFIQTCSRRGSEMNGYNGDGDIIPDCHPYRHLISKVSYEDGETCINSNKVRENGMDKEEKEGNISDVKKDLGLAHLSKELIKETKCAELSNEIGYNADEGNNDDINDEIFDSVEELDEWGRELVEYLSNNDIARGFEDAQALLLDSEPQIRSSLNLDIPVTPRRNDSMSPSLPYAFDSLCLDGDIINDNSLLPRMNENSINLCNLNEGGNAKEQIPCLIMTCKSARSVPPSLVIRAPWKKMKKSESIDGDEKDDEKQLMNLIEDEDIDNIGTDDTRRKIVVKG